jgi:phosphoglycolate phosphatase-like HAD superfamily hydrolase
LRTPDRVTAVLFDVDGTLVDSVDAHARAWVGVFEEFGYEVEYDRVRGMIGMGGDKVLPVAIGVEKDSDEGKRIAERRREIFFERELRTIGPTAGAEALLDALRGGDVRIGFATSAQPDELRPLLEIINADDLLDSAANSGDVSNSKPDPDVIHAALEKNGFTVDETVLIGDTSYDIDAAVKAGVATIALRCGGWRDEDLRGAIAIFDDPADLLAHADQSPLAGVLSAHGARS